MTSERGPRARVIIVGGGFAGLAAARRLRRAAADVTLIDRQNHHLFQPLLYQVATAALSPGNIAAPIRKVLSRFANTDVIMANVTAVDVEARTVTAMGHDYSYDYLVLAAGARTNYFGRPEWGRHAPGLKTIDEAIDIRRRFLLAFEQAEVETDDAARRAVLTFAIVGAGPTGVEMAGAMAEIARHTLRRDFRHFDPGTVRVILLDMADRVLPTFSPRLSTRAQRDLERLGVEVRLDTRVLEVDDAGLAVACDDRRERIDAHNVIWAAGVRAASIGSSLGAETDRGGHVVVAPDLTIPGHPEVFVTGDLAHCTDARGAHVPGVAQGAIQMGAYAGDVIAREVRARARGAAAPTRAPFAYRDKGSMATIGRNKAVAHIGRFEFGGWLAFVAWGLVHVLFLIGFRRKLFALAEWFFMYVFYQRGVRLITGDRVAPKPVKPPADDRGAGHSNTS